MNAGRIEQLGNPTELYESPDTAYVANFLGQSNLIRATVNGRAGDDLVLDAQGTRLLLPLARRTSGENELLIGIRPEKIHLTTRAEHADGAHNVLSGGVVTDASFTGVSTQYLVRLPWGQEIMVFAQNLGVGGVLVPGTEVSLSWDPAHAFALDGHEDEHAGVEHDEGLTPVPVG
jgi:spermidine/putrescine transport system ATP-binding protein